MDHRELITQVLTVQNYVLLLSSLLGIALYENTLISIERVHLLSSLLFR
jgi:hypothetical protein